jgi:hypothetical protein
MSYSDFDLKKIKSTFPIEIIENDDLFSTVAEESINLSIKGNRCNE